MLVVRRHGYAYSQPVEPISGTGNLPISPTELLTQTVNCTSRSALIATDEVRKAIIELPDEEFLGVLIEIKNQTELDLILDSLINREIKAAKLNDSNLHIYAEIHLPEFLKLCRDDRVVSIQLPHPAQQ